MILPDVNVLVHAHNTDAHLAALAMERGYVLYSTDADFARFPALRWVNPCGK